MLENINLIPSEVIKERALNSTFNRILLLSFSILLISIIGLALSAFLSNQSQAELSSFNRQVDQAQEKIKLLEDVEKKGSKLVAKLSFSQSLLSNKIYYSVIMDEISKKTISGVSINNISVAETFEVTITGTSSSTTNLQNYVSNLVAGPNNLFSDAKIRQVTVQEENGDVTFGITVQADASKLVGIK